MEVSGLHLNFQAARTNYFYRRGLLLDGFNENADINLHKEYMRSDNIVSLFHK